MGIAGESKEWESARSMSCKRTSHSVSPKIAGRLLYCQYGLLDFMPGSQSPDQPRYINVTLLPGSALKEAKLFLAREIQMCDINSCSLQSHPEHSGGSEEAKSSCIPDLLQSSKDISESLSFTHHFLHTPVANILLMPGAAQRRV